MSKAFPFLIFFLLPLFISSQNPEYQSILLPKELSQNANAVVRNEQIEIEIRAVDKMIIRTERVVTIFNEYGNGVARTWDIYDEVTKIRKQEARFYDELG